MKDAAKAIQAPTFPTCLRSSSGRVIFRILETPNGTLSTIYDPFTTAPNPNGSGSVRTPFVGNRIPQSMLDPVREVMDLYPLPNTTGDAITNARNFAAAGKTVTTNDRLDFASTGQGARR